MLSLLHSNLLPYELSSQNGPSQPLNARSRSESQRRLSRSHSTSADQEGQSDLGLCLSARINLHFYIFGEKVNDPGQSFPGLKVPQYFPLPSKSSVLCLEDCGARLAPIRSKAEKYTGSFLTGFQVFRFESLRATCPPPWSLLPLNCHCNSHCRDQQTGIFPALITVESDLFARLLRGWGSIKQLGICVSF